MSHGREILQMVEALASEKGVDAEIVFQALEFAIASAARRQFHPEDVEVRCEVDRRTGEHAEYRVWQVVSEEDFTTPSRQYMLSEAREIDPGKEIGDTVEEPMEQVDFGRIGAQAAKQAILQKVRDAEREQILQDFLDRDENLINGVIKRVEGRGYGAAIIEIGRLEARLPRDQMIPRENLREGDRVWAWVTRVERGPRGPQLFLSRVVKEFLVALFEREVPEIEEGLLEIRAAARDPGMRAKIAVWSNDPRIEPIGTCIGIRGSRVTAVTNELAGERVDIIPWVSDPVQFIINALHPAVVERIKLDEDARTADVVVAEENLAQAIGRGGQNVRLASELSGFTINIVSAVEQQEQEQAEFQKLLDDMMSRLDVDEDVATVLIDRGIESLEILDDTPLSVLVAEVEEIDEESLQELKTRAQDALLAEQVQGEMQLGSIAPELRNMEGMDYDTALLLGNHGITSVDELADLSTDDLCELTGLDPERASQLIMTARAPWFA